MFNIRLLKPEIYFLNINFDYFFFYIFTTFIFIHKFIYITLFPRNSASKESSFAR